MADVCDYVYVSGLRFKSGDPYVEIPAGYLEALTGKTPQDPRALVRLSVVRDGKGASRTERWADKPARFGVTGEINLRDLGIILEKQGLQDIDAQVPLSIDGNQEVVPLVLNPSAGMGRRGRLIDPEAIEDLLMSLPDDTVQELIKDQLRNMPYGLENSKAAAVRLGVLLQHATDDTITDVISSGSSDFVKHIDRDLISHLGKEVTTAVGYALTRSGRTQEALSFRARKFEASINERLDAILSAPSQFIVTKLPEGYTNARIESIRDRQIDEILYSLQHAESSVKGNLDQKWLSSLCSTLDSDGVPMQRLEPILAMLRDREAALTFIATSPRALREVSSASLDSPYNLISSFASDEAFKEAMSEIIPGFTVDRYRSGVDEKRDRAREKVRHIQRF